MLKASSPNEDAVRFSTPDVLEQYVAGTPARRIPVSQDQAVEETFFLGLRLNSGVDLRQLTARFGEDVVAAQNPAIEESINDGLLEREDNVIRLTRRGRLLSNDVFERFVGVSAS
jgi:oxygen-independent coproporphyrinogen-3 oxidase